jgi:hypothetical protein
MDLRMGIQEHFGYCFVVRFEGIGYFFAAVFFIVAFLRTPSTRSRRSSSAFFSSDVTTFVATMDSRIRPWFPRLVTKIFHAGKSEPYSKGAQSKWDPAALP